MNFEWNHCWIHLCCLEREQFMFISLFEIISTFLLLLMYCIIRWQWVPATRCLWICSMSQFCRWISMSMCFKFHVWCFINGLCWLVNIVHIHWPMQVNKWVKYLALIIIIMIRCNNVEYQIWIGNTINSGMTVK